MGSGSDSDEDDDEEEEEEDEEEGGNEQNGFCFHNPTSSVAETEGEEVGRHGGKAKVGAMKVEDNGDVDTKRGRKRARESPLLGPVQPCKCQLVESLIDGENDMKS